MTHEVAKPKIASETAELHKGATGNPANQAYAAAKRFCDIVIIIVIALPVLLTTVLAMLAIFWTMGVPALLQQDRIGQGGRLFRQLKLRTRAEGPPNYASATLVGQFLEDSSIAELPQLWNVLVGDMSIVGPCPEWPHLASLFRERLPNYELRQSVRPGITGYAQVYLGCTSAQTKLEYDLHYVRHMGALLDINILLDSAIPGRQRTPIVTRP